MELPDGYFGPIQVQYHRGLQSQKFPMENPQTRGQNRPRKSLPSFLHGQILQRHLLRLASVFLGLVLRLVRYHQLGIPFNQYRYRACACLFGPKNSVSRVFEEPESPSPFLKTHTYIQV